MNLKKKKSLTRVKASIDANFQLTNVKLLNFTFHFEMTVVYFILSNI